MKANRWLHLRHPDGFSPEMFERFRSSCALWEAYVSVSIREWQRLGAPDGDPRYTCLDPELSSDRQVATLPLAAVSTLGSRARYEDSASHLLRTFLPLDFHLAVEEGHSPDVFPSLEGMELG